MTNMESTKISGELKKLKINSCIVVKVTRIEDYVVFVEKDGIHGLIQITDLSWSNDIKPHELLCVGDEIEVKVTMIDIKSSRKEKFRASIKAMRPQDNPWKDPTCFSIGKKFEGKVKKKTSFGYLIQIEAGVIALLPVSDENIKEELTINSTIKVKIEKIDVELEKIQVSLVRSF